MEATSIDGLVAHCQSARFTGILRMRAREGIGEIWFLSGVADEVHFGTSTADEAMERMRKATEATYELVARLPDPAGGFKRAFPSKGSIATATPVTLMRYSEQYALTCKLAVESGNVLVEATYALGELVSVETTADDDGITAMLEAKEGTYEFTLPRVELPPGTPVLPPASSSLMESLPPPESLGFRALLEAKPLIGRPARDEAEVKRKTVEIARQQKAATASKPVQKEEAKPTATSGPPKAAAAPPKTAEREEAKPAATPRAATTRAVPRPATASKPAKDEVKPTAASVVEDKREEPPKPATTPSESVPAKPPDVAEAANDEAKPAAEPLVEDKRAEERAAPPKDEQEAEPESEPAKTLPTAPPAKRSWTWVVVALVVVVALGYFFWTNRS